MPFAGSRYPIFLVKNGSPKHKLRYLKVRYEPSNLPESGIVPGQSS